MASNPTTDPAIILQPNEILSLLPPSSQTFSPSFLSRHLKHTAAMGYIHETAQDTYLATNFIKSLTIPIIGAGYSLFTGPKNTGGTARPLLSLSSWLMENGYQEPGSTNDPTGPFQYGHGTEDNLFEWFQANKPADEQFNYHMGGYSHGRPNWFDEEVYPVRERLVRGFDGQSALLVDIAGGLGHDIEAFARRFPDVKGRLVLQDLEHVIAQGKAARGGDEASRVERTVYDFHTDQPVKGARAYYMHSVLHDWSDEVCVSILENVKMAMQAGYSRLLINENAVPETGASWEITSLDIVLGSLLSSRERTRVEWMRLLEEKAGLKVTKIYHYLGDPKTGVESLIECELV